MDNGEGTSLLEALTAYTANSTGTFFNKNVGTDKGYTVAASTNVVATGNSGATYYGLSVPGFTRAAGPWQSGAPGNAISEVTPLAITVSGVRAVDRAYNGLISVALDVSAASLPGTIAGDSIGLSGGSGTMLDKNVGVAKPVTLAALTFGGADAGNYSFGLSGALAVNISPLDAWLSRASRRRTRSMTRRRRRRSPARRRSRRWPTMRCPSAAPPQPASSTRTPAWPSR